MELPSMTMSFMEDPPVLEMPISSYIIPHNEEIVKNRAPLRGRPVWLILLWL